MAKVDIDIKFQLHLSAREIRLVQMALAGQLTKEISDEARRLAATISQERSSATVGFVRKLVLALNGREPSVSPSPTKPQTPLSDSEVDMIELDPE